MGEEALLELRERLKRENVVLRTGEEELAAARDREVGGDPAISLFCSCLYSGYCATICPPGEHIPDVSG